MSVIVEIWGVDAAVVVTSGPSQLARDPRGAELSSALRSTRFSQRQGALRFRRCCSPLGVELENDCPLEVFT